MQCSNNHEMFDMGKWPGPDMVGIVNRWHCRTCDEYKSEPVSNLDLAKQEDGTYLAIPKENAEG